VEWTSLSSAIRILRSKGGNSRISHWFRIPVRSNAVRKWRLPWELNIRLFDSHMHSMEVEDLFTEFFSDFSFEWVSETGLSSFANFLRRCPAAVNCLNDFELSLRSLCDFLASFHCNENRKSGISWISTEGLDARGTGRGNLTRTILSKKYEIGEIKS